MHDNTWQLPATLRVQDVTQELQRLRAVFDSRRPVTLDDRHAVMEDCGMNSGASQQGFTQIQHGLGMDADQQHFCRTQTAQCGDQPVDAWIIFSPARADQALRCQARHGSRCQRPIRHRFRQGVSQ